MKPAYAIVIAGMLCAGCALLAPPPEPARNPPEPARNPLEQADARIAAADYSGAQDLYAEFVNANPGNPQAARAQAMQAVLDLLLSSQSELARLNRSEEVPRLRREIAERQREVERLKAENTKLRADLERLRNIDLQTRPGAKQ